MNFSRTVIALLLVACSNNADASDSVNTFSEQLEHIATTSDTPLIAVAVATANELNYSARYIAGTGISLTPQEGANLSRFHSASISKLFTAVVVMQLRDEGSLALDDPVNKYLPAFNGRSIQIRHLLTHTSGLRDRKRANGRRTPEEVENYITSLARQRLKSTPGTKWHYADANFNLLGRVIEQITGAAFAEVMKRRLLQPLTMASSSFDIDDISKSNRAQSFGKRGKPLKHPWDRAFLPSSGLQTNALDLIRFAQAVLKVNGGQHSERFLKLTTLKEMTAAQTKTTWPGIEQGYAWQLVERATGPEWRHAGGESGFESLLSIYPESGVAIVALGNKKDWPRFQLAKLLREAAIDSAIDNDSGLAKQSAQPGEAANVVLSPMGPESWKAEFSWTTPVTQLDFVRHSDKRRPNRLTVVDDNFEIFSTDEGDAIRRRDGAAFTAVAVIEPTIIEDPPSGYLPFAKFGDGGLLLHTGRFHTCAGPCPGENGQNEGPWFMTINIDTQQRMILNGAVKTGPSSFKDTDNGTKIYIGNGAITTGSNLLAVIDKALPAGVKQKLDELFPPLMNYFGKRLVELTETQMLFASYNVPGDVEEFSIKGGVLPRQVFMHFEGKEIAELSRGADFPYFLSWFFAHEAAHLHQGDLPSNYDKADSWIHEGSADAFAYLYLQQLDAPPTSYLTQRVNKAKQSCANALAQGPLRTALEREQPFQSLYDCGLIIHLSVHAMAQVNSSSDLFKAWTNFRDRIASGSPWNTTTYVAVVTELAGEATAELVDRMITEQLEDPAKFLDQLAAPIVDFHAGRSASRVQ